MANSNKFRPLPEETLAGTGTVTPQSRDKVKHLTMTANVTLNAPSGAYPGDEYVFYITLGGFVLTLDAAYTSRLTTPPTILEETILIAKVLADGTIVYYLAETGA